MIQRLSLFQDSALYQDDNNGKYVRYQDHLAVVEQLEYELRFLREQLAEAKEQHELEFRMIGY